MTSAGTDEPADGEALAVTFNDALLTSIHDVVEVARYFVRQNIYHVRLPEIILQPKYVKGGADRGDLFVTSRRGTEFRIEAKGHADKPFEVLAGYDKIYLDRVSILDAKPLKPHYYFVLGCERLEALVFDMKHFEKVQRVKPVPDKRTGSMVDTYTVPRDSCERITL